MCLPATAWAKSALLSYSQVRQTKAVWTYSSTNSAQLSDTCEIRKGMMISVGTWNWGAQVKKMPREYISLTDWYSLQRHR